MLKFELKEGEEKVNTGIGVREENWGKDSGAEPSDLHNNQDPSVP